LKYEDLPVPTAIFKDFEGLEFLFKIPRTFKDFQGAHEPHPLMEFESGNVCMYVSWLSTFLDNTSDSRFWTVSAGLQSLPLPVGSNF